MLERTRRSRSQLVRVFVLSACLATSTIGCSAVTRLAELAARPVSPDPELQQLTSRRRAFDDLVTRSADPDHEPTGAVILRLSLTGGWALQDPEGLHLTIQDDGRVIRVTDRSVFSSTRDYTSLRLDPAGIIRVLQMMERLLPADRADLDGGAGVSPTDRSAWLEVGDALALSMDRIGQTDGYTPEDRAWRARFAGVIERLEDLTWLGEAIIEPESPWIPSSMTVLAGPVSPRSGLGPGTAFAPWPLDRTIEELAVGTTRNAYDEERLILCLTADQVGPVFALLTGVNRAYLPVDDGKEWELSLEPHYPGYRLASDPCP
jgi:hypothetical protein